jgi:hypothetical protein
MSTAGHRVLIGTLVAAGLAHPMADAFESARGEGQATFISRVEKLQQMLKGKFAPEAGTELAQGRSPSWVDFSRWAQCGTDVKC